MLRSALIPCLLAIGLLHGSQSRADDAAPVAEQYQALLREYRPVSGGLRKAKTDDERMAAYQAMASFPNQMLDLIEAHPQDALAPRMVYDAIQTIDSTDSMAHQLWDLNEHGRPRGRMAEPTRRVVKVLLEHHVRGDHIGPILDRVRYGYRLEYKPYLEAVLEQNPGRQMRGLACLALAQYLADKNHMRQIANDRADMAERFDAIFGSSFLKSLQEQHVEFAKQSETLFARAAKEFADVPFRSDIVGETAQRALYELRVLAVGKPAPDIAGPDQNGKTFKLSDYRGKVVLLYVWSEF